MRKYIFIILTLVCVLGNKSYAQELTSAEKEKIIAELDSTDFWVRSGALEKIKQYNITEAIPKLLENIWKEGSSGLSDIYLDCLFKLKYRDFNQLAHEFIDSADSFNYKYSADSPLTDKMYATTLLIENGDYSTVNYLFDAIKKDSTYDDAIFYIKALKKVAQNIPEYKDSAIVNLIKIANRKAKNDLDKKYKFMALYSLNEIEGINIDSIAVELLGKSETEFSIKMLMLKILSDRNYTGLEELIKERIKSDTSNLFQVALVMKLTEKYYNPSTLSFLKKLLPMESDNKMKKMLKIKTTIFKPTKPESTISTSTMLDTLTSYTNQSYGYDWLKDEAYKTELLNKLTNAKTKLTSGDSLGCRTEVAAFQNSVAQVYADSAGSYPKYISNEGYKFLYYYAGYILDRLPRSNSNKDVNRRRWNQIPAFAGMMRCENPFLFRSRNKFGITVQKRHEMPCHAELDSASNVSFQISVFAAKITPELIAFTNSFVTTSSFVIEKANKQTLIIIIKRI